MLKSYVANLDKVCEELEFNRYKICMYEKVLKLNFRRDEKGNRIFSSDDIKKLSVIKYLEQLNFGVEEVKEACEHSQIFEEDNFKEEIKRLIQQKYIYVNDLKEMNESDIQRQQSNFSFDNTILPSISNKNFPQYFFSIIALFEEDCDYNLTQCYAQNNRLFLKGYNSDSRKKCELMLRYGTNTLNVARIEFIHQREGKMTELYRILKLMKKEYELKGICVEGDFSEEMKAWCLKNKFVLDHGNSLYIEKEYYDNK